MCRQIYLRYSYCGCELRQGPLRQCPFGPQDPRCHEIINVVRPSPSSSYDACPYHIWLRKHQRVFTYTTRGFELWAGGRHYGVYWPIGKNPDYNPRSWDYYGEPYTKKGKLSSDYYLWNTPEKQRTFGLARKANWDAYFLEKLRKRSTGGDGYQADDEATFKGPDRHGRGGFYVSREKQEEASKILQPSASEEEEEKDNRSDSWLDIQEAELEDAAPFYEPTLMWGCWDDRELVSESVVEESQGTEEDSDMSMGSNY
ncbi:hypothetical protein QBC33DRAFT_546187 [Phialemonium atrogriseum]|uniref:Uncharacterized protein n=1 Tax=Phialemonium atrogriseum TaxID=1093897 RepID=A0AAJ0BUR1_9PEZI|nr:uncharacterized protein QBC33DRAFT_546187 [Phialemonium atrogriseum]KAK1764843.1 hypothetical protein QBC33DRAFT_546187 [Phialemonium atrogriseum]